MNAKSVVEIRVHLTNESMLIVCSFSVGRPCIALPEPSALALHWQTAPQQQLRKSVGEWATGCYILQFKTAAVSDFFGHVCTFKKDLLLTKSKQHISLKRVEVYIFRTTNPFSSQVIIYWTFCPSVSHPDTLGALYHVCEPARKSFSHVVNTVELQQFGWFSHLNYLRRRPTALDLGKIMVWVEKKWCYIRGLSLFCKWTYVRMLK